jgi:hypothetical protein
MMIIIWLVTEAPSVELHQELQNRLSSRPYGEAVISLKLGLHDSEWW